jgi:hypothetical protein
VFARTPAETADAQRLTKSIQDYAMRGTLQARSTQKPGSPAPAPGQTTVTETPRLGDLTREPPLTATGKLVNVECRPRTPTVIEVRTNTQLIRLVVDNPSAIQVLGRPTPTVDLKCGGQNVTIRVGYVAASDANLSTIGSVRLLDYRQP